MVILNYERGKPELFLKPLENAVLEIPTQEHYDMIMMIFQAGRWRDNQNQKDLLPTKTNYWKRYEEDTCVELKYRFLPEHAWNAAKENKDFIFIPKFYEMNGITKENCDELRFWFDRHFPDRESKGKKQL